VRVIGTTSPTHLSSINLIVGIRCLQKDTLTRLCNAYIWIQIGGDDIDQDEWLACKTMTKLVAIAQAQQIGKERVRRKEFKSSLLWAQQLCFDSPFNQAADFVKSLSGGDEGSQSLSGEDVDDDSDEDEMMDLLPNGEESGPNNGFSSGEDD
jgi:hypothetical protein